MGELLKEHALANLWCEPIQDRQHTLTPARLTPAGGSFRSFEVLWENIPLPNFSDNTRRRYHVYQIGQLDPATFNMDIPLETWINFATISNDESMVVQAFLTNGCVLPNHECWFYWANDFNLLVAVAILPTFDLGMEYYYNDQISQWVYRKVTLDNFPVHVRFYSNSRFDSIHWQQQALDPIHGIQSVISTLNSVSDYSQFIADCDAIASFFGSQGKGVFYQDGFVCNRPTGWNSSLSGKTYSFVWDATIKETGFYKLSELPVFNSQLDIGNQKYLLVRETAYDMIDFHDDVDFYLVSRDTSTVFKGIYIHRLDPKTIRQVTHNAYALRKSVIDDLVSKHTLFATSSKNEIMVVVREGGMVRGLSPQLNRVEELYRLPRNQILAAMEETNVAVPEWRASALENSAYTAVMRSDIDDITASLVEDAYGYNAVTRAIADPPCPIDNTGIVPYVNVPNLLDTKDKETNGGCRTLFGYENGLLKGYWYDTGLYDGVPVPSVLGTVDRVECFNYQLSDSEDGVVYDADVTSHDLKQYGFRCYVTPIVGGLPSGIWEDITDYPFFNYDPVGDVGNGFTPTLTWNHYLLDAGNLYPCVKINKVMQIHRPDLTDFPGFIRFQLQANGNPMTLEPAMIDVFVSGESLIEDVDYFVRFPWISIHRRPSSVINADSVIVRTYGCCDPVTMKHDSPREKGWVKGRIASINESYDIRNDRPIRVVVEGLFKTRDQVRFSESGTGPLLTEGRPYAVTDYPIAVENFTGKQTIPYRQQAIDLDERVIAYLTARLPQPTVPHPMIFEERWRAFSPFCSAIIRALQNELISVSSPPYNLAYVEPLVTPWLYLLDVDPCVAGFDPEYQIVLPHPYLDEQTLPIEEYLFVEFVIRHYLNGKTDQSYSVSVEV